MFYKVGGEKCRQGRTVKEMANGVWCGNDISSANCRVYNVVNSQLRQNKNMLYVGQHSTVARIPHIIHFKNTLGTGTTHTFLPFSPMLPLDCAPMPH